MAAEAAAIICSCLQHICSCVQSQVLRNDIDFMCRTDVLMKDLHTDARHLKALQEDVKLKLENEERKHGKKPTKQVQSWLRKVDEISPEIEELTTRHNRLLSIPGCCLAEYCSRHNISREATRIAQKITVLMTEKNNFEVLAEMPLENPARNIPSSSDIQHDIIKSYLKKIHEYLNDEKVQVIGIYGMGGVGKTTLLNAINNSLGCDENMGFHNVVTVQSSHKLSLEILRKEIAEQLKLPNDYRSTIFNFLTNKKNLFLIDDVCQKLDFGVAGIPLGISSSKVIFTTGNKAMCAEMGAKNAIVEVRCFQREKARSFFEEIVGIEIIDSNPKIKECAMTVADKCGGLPLALKLIGRAMSNCKEIEEWEHVAAEMSRPCNTIMPKAKQEMYEKLRFSYESLESPTWKKCFLCLTLWFRHPVIYKEDVIKCWMGLGLIPCRRYVDAYNDGCYIINRLKDACLLETNGSDEIRLHDVVMGMAHWVATESGTTTTNKWIVTGKEYSGLAQVVTLREIEQWLNAERVSVAMDSKIQHLSMLPPNCPNLLSLMLQNNSFLESLPEGIFQQMPNLEYMDLSFTGLKRLPAGIKHLNKLSYLNISGTQIRWLPGELRNLKELKFLICKYLKLNVLEEGFISSLLRLEVLELQPYSFAGENDLRSSVGVLRSIGMLVKSIELFNLLSELPTCNIHLEQLNELKSFEFESLSCSRRGWLQELEVIACENLEEIVMNNGSGAGSRLLKLRLSCLKKLNRISWGKQMKPDDYFGKLTYLYVIKCKSLKNLGWVLQLPCLVSLWIKQCDVMEKLVDDGKEEEIQEEVETTFPRLEILSICCLPKLVTIRNGSLEFPCLSNLIVRDCPNLRRLPFNSHITSSKFRALRCEKGWWLALKWEDDSVKSYLSSKTNFEESPATRGQASTSFQPEQLISSPAIEQNDSERASPPRLTAENQLGLTLGDQTAHVEARTSCAGDLIANHQDIAIPGGVQHPGISG